VTAPEKPGTTPGYVLASPTLHMSIDFVNFETSDRATPVEPVAGLVRIEPISDRRITVRGRWLRRMLVPILLLVIWQWGPNIGLDLRGSLTSPSIVATTFWHLLRHGQLAADIGASLGRAGLGLVIGLSAGLLLGVISGLSRIGEDLVDATLQMSRTLPFLALVPLFVLWFGIGELPKVLLIALACLWPAYINTFAGIRGVDSRLVEVARTVGLTRVQMIRRVLLPGALPSMLVGLRYALAFSVLALVAAEEINATNGLGALMTNAEQYFQTPVLILVLVIYAALGLLADVIVRVLEHFLLTWQATYSGANR
jgi:sulfonate transport system permease protein